MTTLAMDRIATAPATLFDELPIAVRRLVEPASLDELISGAWEGLAVRELAACPVCAGEMRRRLGDRPGVMEGCCRDCGSTLS